MDPVRNPYAPGAGQRPPELAGRDREIGQFEVVLERVARGRPERSMVLTGLRGVGKTVLLNSFRSMAMQRLWGTGKLEARPDQSIRRPVASALHMAVRELAQRHRAPERIDHFLGVLKAFAARDAKAPKGSIVTQLGIDAPAVRGRADSGDLEVDLTELFADAASVAADLGVGIALTGVLFLLAALHHPRRTGRTVYAVLIGLAALATAAVAARHVYVQHLPPGSLPSCGAPLGTLFKFSPFFEVIKKVLTGSGECGEVNWRFLGLAMPAWVLLWSLGLAALGLRANRTHSFTLWMEAFSTPSSTTCAPKGAMKRPSEVPPPVVSFGMMPATSNTARLTASDKDPGGV